MTKKKLKIAFVMGGGGSLGSFSSGALAYVIDNLSKNLNTDKYSKCEIDVFSGSSAGAASLAACAFELCRGNQPDELLKRLWLDKDKGLDILNFLPDDFEKHQEPSILSSKIMTDIIEEVFVKADVNNVEPLKTLTGKEIRIGLSITNLNGIRKDISDQIIDPQYINDYNPLHDIVKTFWHGDRRKFKIKLKETDNLDIKTDKEYLTFGYKSNQGWKELGYTVKASGAFPFTLPPVGLLRRKEEFGPYWPFENEEMHTCYYSDGGLIDNEPLRLAMNMANDADIDENEEFDRIFVVIDPIVGSDSEDFNIINRAFPEKIENSDFFSELFSFGKKFIGLLFTEARYEDWQKAENENKRIKLTEEFIGQIPDLINVIDDTKSIEGIKSKLYNDLVKVLLNDFHSKSNNKVVQENPQIEELIKIQLDMVLRKYRKIVEMLDEGKKELFAYFAALLENVSGVFNKQQIKLIGIAPESESSTKGDFLSTFGGYLNVNWRKFDYKVGKYQAYKTLDRLPEHLKLVNSNLEIRNKPENCENPVYADAPVEAREKFENYLYGMFLSVLGYLKFWQRLKIGIGFIFFKKKVASEVVKIIVQKLNN